VEYPCYFFFYGSLCDPKLLARTLRRSYCDEALLRESYRTAMAVGFRNGVLKTV